MLVVFERLELIGLAFNGALQCATSLTWRRSGRLGRGPTMLPGWFVISFTSRYSVGPLFSMSYPSDVKPLRSIDELLLLMEACLWLNDGSYELLNAELEDHPDNDGSF